MYRRLGRWMAWTLVLTFVISIQAAWALAQQGSISGTVVDPLGASVPAATVILLREGQPVTERSSGGRGEFTFEAVPAGRYQIEARAPGFESRVTDQVFVGSSGQVTMQVAMQIGPLLQEVVVTAAATELPVSQIGSPVTIINQGTLEQLGKHDVLEALRTVPGMQVLQTGQRGGTTALFVRGGASNFNKVLIDGIPANDIGGAFDIADVATTGIDNVEVLRSANSVLYGSDALTGVVSVTTRRGSSHIPELSYSIDGGNLGTLRQAASIGGAVNRFDYFLDVSRFDTDNNVPNNTFHSGSLAGRFGLALGSTTDLSATVRRSRAVLGLPGAINYSGIANDASQKNTLSFAGVTANSQWADGFQTTARVAVTERHYRYINPSPTGEPFDPFGFGANYLGSRVTIRGANGTTASGRAILDFGGRYPSTFDSSTRRWFFYGQTDYNVFSTLDVSAGVRFENEYGFADSSGSRSRTKRNNAGYFVEGRSRLGGRLYVHGGLGFEHNEIFGFELTPRVSAAVYVRTPSSTAAFGDTKLTFNFGNGIKQPTLFQEQSSLHTLLRSAPQGQELIARTGVSPVGPERSRSVDAGIEQGFWGGRARVRTAFFHNNFEDLIEFVSKNVLPQVGVPAAAAAATPFGAYVNSQTYRARGLETSGEVMLARVVRVSGSYLYLDTVVRKSFTGGALAPAFNPAYPGVPIGVFSPLVGGRPFRRPTHSGNMVVSYTRGPAQVLLAGYFAGRADDSTFLSDANFGNSLVLPNRNLANSYQKVDLSGSYRFHPRVRWYASIENVLDREYESGSGFPALPLAVRTGLTLTFGGEGSGTP